MALGRTLSHVSALSFFKGILAMRNIHLIIFIRVQPLEMKL